MNQKKNRGDATFTGIIVGLIILIMVFAIIIYFMLNFLWTETIDAESCHQSVLSRATFKLGPLEGSRVIPLNCETEKICFTEGEDCKTLVATKKGPVRKIELKGDDSKIKQEILDVLAESMKQCHWMFGEGKLDFMPHTIRGLDKTNYGLICTRFAFDDKIKEKIKGISYGELYGYLEKKGNREGMSYLEYIYPGWRNSGDSIKLFEMFKEHGSKDLENIDFKDWKINFKEENGYAIIVQIASRDQGWAYLAGAGTAIAIPAALGLASTGVGLPVAAVLLGGVTTISTGSFIAGSAVLWYNYNDEFDYGAPAIYPFNIEELKKYEIFSFEVAP